MDIKRIVAHNLFERNDVWRFDPLVAAQRGPSLPRLAGMKVMCEDAAWPRDFDAMNAACVQEVRPLLFSSVTRQHNYRVWLFVAHSAWAADSRILRYRKLWKTFSSFTFREFDLSQEVLIESKEGVRYAGVARVNANGLLEATRVLRSFGSVALIMSRRDGVNTESGIRMLFQAAFPIGKRENVTRVDWQHLAEKICPLGDVAIKAGGDFDDREVYIDLILSSETMMVLGWSGL